eukprot:TRINITY_DN9213_c0_g1_i1.p1 TRINITY_DN9213_c0_g1~~TRINITY_DN9213_c0_g1_i1.p1  ORF type:complete len:318 (+),score=52.90 TRINITY_DN9213_c0_g1_i1:15-968(+)
MYPCKIPFVSSTIPQLENFSLGISRQILPELATSTTLFLFYTADEISVLHDNSVIIFDNPEQVLSFIATLCNTSHISIIFNDKSYYNYLARFCDVTSVYMRRNVVSHMTVVYGDKIIFFHEYKTFLEGFNIDDLHSVEELKIIWSMIEEFLLSVTGCNIPMYNESLHTLCLNFYIRTMPDDVKLYPPSSMDEYFDIVSSFYDNRSSYIPGIYKSVIGLDVNSLYPAAMKYLDHPYGRCLQMEGESPREQYLGVYNIVLTHDFPLTISQSFVPYRDTKNRLTFGPTETTGWYSTYDIKIAEMEGYSVKYTGKGYEWKK